MARKCFVDTIYDIISVCITFDSKFAIAIVFRSDKINVIRIYALNSADMCKHFVSEHEIKGFYVKAKSINQTDDGQLFNCPYFDDGNFWLLLFNTEKTIEKIDISEMLKIDRRSRPNVGFPDPLINACFIGEDRVFINLFHNRDLNHWHLIYNYKEKKIVGEPVCVKLGESKLNFPYNNFYDSKRQKVYCFYRQGQSFTVDVNPNHDNVCTYKT
jgi:hypothetical protein